MIVSKQTLNLKKKCLLQQRKDICVYIHVCICTYIYLKQLGNNLVDCIVREFNSHSISVSLRLFLYIRKSSTCFPVILENLQWTLAFTSLLFYHENEFKEILWSTAFWKLLYCLQYVRRANYLIWQNCRIILVGRDLWRLSSPTSCSKPGQLPSQIR